MRGAHLVWGVDYPVSPQYLSQVQHFVFYSLAFWFTKGQVVILVGQLSLDAGQ